MSNPIPITSKGVRLYKIVILGDGGVGKSALVIQFIHKKFQDYHDPTIEDSYEKQTRIDDEPARLDILDTAGQPEFNAMREQYMRKGEGFVICFSISDRRSFEGLLTHKELIDRVRNGEDIPIVIAGNKCDLQHLRKVSFEEGASISRQLSCPYYETSAATGQCVDEVFHSLIREIRRKEKEVLVAEEREAKRASRRNKRFWRIRRAFSRLNFIRRGRTNDS